MKNELRKAIAIPMKPFLIFQVEISFLYFHAFFPNFSIRTLFPLTRMEFCHLLFVQESLCKWYLKRKKEKVKIRLLGLRLLPMPKVEQST